MLRGDVLGRDDGTVTVLVSWLEPERVAAEREFGSVSDSRLAASWKVTGAVLISALVMFRACPWALGEAVSRVRFRGLASGGGGASAAAEMAFEGVLLREAEAGAGLSLLELVGDSLWASC